MTSTRSDASGSPPVGVELVPLQTIRLGYRCTTRTDFTSALAAWFGEVREIEGGRVRVHFYCVVECKSSDLRRLIERRAWLSQAILEAKEDEWLTDQFADAPSNPMLRVVISNLDLEFSESYRNPSAANVVQSSGEVHALIVDIAKAGRAVSGYVLARTCTFADSGSLPRLVFASPTESIHNDGAAPDLLDPWVGPSVGLYWRKFESEYHVYMSGASHGSAHHCDEVSAVEGMRRQISCRAFEPHERQIHYAVHRDWYVSHAESRSKLDRYLWEMFRDVFGELIRSSPRWIGGSDTSATYVVRELERRSDVVGAMVFRTSRSWPGSVVVESKLPLGSMALVVLKLRAWHEPVVGGPIRPTVVLASLKGAAFDRECTSDGSGEIVEPLNRVVWWDLVARAIVRWSEIVGVVERDLGHRTPPDHRYFAEW